MAKQLNIDVNLNTAKASAQLKSLQQMLQEAINGTTSKGTLTREIVQATEAATKLKSILNSSMNSKGNLDLSKFSANLKASGTNLTQYAQQLNNLGTTGQQAFMSMAKQITTAQAPLKQTNTLTQSLFTSLKNTARWQLSSAMLHGVINTFHNAFSYARGLNDSLNSIRIVTGLSADEMNRFAESANKSAKALSASTLDYTDAALIYYQQGIRDQQQIKERTDATIKMANVTGDSAAKVSNQLTAIWNNFDKGGQNLEYYADVITALGAATASSSSEISAGLEKFASIAEETGLSYEYATSSLATIVATTRQSADVVGTALKTIFGRVQSLNLGETLEDGTTLGKYSKALEKVGINIKDQNGQLKDMDVILDEMGGKWETLNRDQKVAMAQAVAGARQYNQLMALMENYDFFKQNVDIARGSKGTLEKQQEIYAESWQAAKDRVKASWQGILDDVISDDFFIGVNNGFAGLLSGVNKFIDTIGGIPGTLGLVGAAFMKLFQNPINKGISNLTTSIKTLKRDYVKEQSALQNQVVSAVGAITPRKDSPQSNIMQVNNLKQSVSLSNAYAQKMQAIANMGMTISNADRTRIASLQQLVNFYGELEVKAQQMVEQEQAATEAVQARIAAQAEARAISSTTGSQGTKIMAGVRAKEESTSRTNEAVQSYRTALLGQAGLKSIGNGFALSSDMRTSLGAFVNQALGRMSATTQVPLTYQDFISRYGFRTAFDGQGSKPQTINSSQQAKLFSQFQRTGIMPAGFELWTRKNNGNFDSRYIGSYGNILNQSSTVQNPAYARAQSSADFFNSKRFDNAARHITRAYQAGVYDKPLEELTEKEQKLYNRSQKALNLINKRASVLDLKGAEKYVASGVIAAAGNGKQGEELRQTVMRGVDAQYQRNAAGQIRNMSADELAKRINAMDPEKVNKGFANAAMGVANVAIGVSSLTAGFKALTNESLTFGEKLLQTSMSFGMGISMMTMGMPGLTKALGGLTKGFSALGALIAGKKLGTLFAADGLFGGAIQSLKGALPAILAITAIVGTIAAIKAAQKAAFEASPEGQLKTAQQHATDMKTALEQTKVAAESLSASFDNYDSVAGNLKSCVKGTQEWTEALRQNNNEVINMLAKYPQLAAIEGAIKKDGDGVLSFSEEGREAIQKQMEQSVRQAEWASAYAQQDVLNKQAQVRASKIGREFKNLKDLEEQTIYYNLRTGTGNEMPERYGEARLGTTSTDSAVASDIANTFNQSGTKEAIMSIGHGFKQFGQEVSESWKDLNIPEANKELARQAKEGIYDPLKDAAKRQYEINKQQDINDQLKLDNLKTEVKGLVEDARATGEYRRIQQDLKDKEAQENYNNWLSDQKEIQQRKRRAETQRKKQEEEARKALTDTTLGRELERDRQKMREAWNAPGAYAEARKEQVASVSEATQSKINIGSDDSLTIFENRANRAIEEHQQAMDQAAKMSDSYFTKLAQSEDAFQERYSERRLGYNNKDVFKTDALQMISGNMVAESYHERADKSINGLFNKFQDPKEAGLNIIAEHWDQLMGLTVDEMGPVLDKVFQGTGISMVDSSAWAKELTTNSDLRAALNENAASMMAAQTAQAAQEASTINEELIAQGYSKSDAEIISNMMGQQGKLSELTKAESDRIDRELRKKDTNARDLAKQYVASLGGMESSVDWEKGGIKYKDASGADQTATWEMMSSALGAAAALEQLGASAAEAASFLATLNSGDVPEDTAKGIQEFLENGNFLQMTPEELQKQALQGTSKMLKDIENIDDDQFKEITGQTKEDFLSEMETQAKADLAHYNETLNALTATQMAEIQGLRRYDEMSAWDIIDYADRHFKDQELIKLPDVGADVRDYQSLQEEVKGVQEGWDAVGDSIKDGAHVTQELNDLFDQLNANQGDLGQFIEGDLIEDAAGLKAYLESLSDPLLEDIEHAKQLDMITYDNLTNELLNLLDGMDSFSDGWNSDIDSILSQMDGLELSIARLEQLRQNLLSNTDTFFNNYTQAQQNDKDSTYLDEWTSDFDDFYDNLTNTGKRGTDAWKAGLELFLPKDMQDTGISRADVQSYLNTLSNTYGFFDIDESGKSSITGQNVINFAEFGKNAGVFTHEGGHWGLAEGITGIESMIERFKTAGIELSEGSMSTFFGEMVQYLPEGKDLWGQMAEAAGDYGTQALVAEEHIKEAAEDMKLALENNDMKAWEEAKGRVDKYSESLTKTKKAANEKVDNIYSTKDDIEEQTKKVEAAKVAWEEYQRTHADASEDSEAYQNYKKEFDELTKLQNKLKELGEISDIEVKFHLEAQVEEANKIIQDTVDKYKKGDLVDQYGHKITSEKGATDYAKSTKEYKTIEEHIQTFVDDTNSSAIYEQIKGNYTDAKATIEGTPIEAEADLKYDKVVQNVGKTRQEVNKINGMSGTAHAFLDISDITNKIATARSQIASLQGQLNTLNSGINRKSTDTVLNGGFSGLGFAQGNAYAEGNFGTPERYQNTLVGELGQELVVNPKTGKYYTVGDYGAELIDLPKGSIVFNHRQTEGLLKNKKINTRGQALLTGNAFVGDFDIPGTSTSSTGGGSGSSAGNNSSSGNGSGGQKKKGGAATAADGEILTYEEQLLTIIRDEVDEYANLERSITRLEHAYKNFTRNNDRLWGKALLENIQNSINQGKKLYEAEYAKLEKRKDDYAKSTARLNSTNELQYQQKVLVGGAYNKDAKYNTQLITFQDFKGMDFLTGLGFLSEDALQRDSNGEVSGVNDAVAVDKAIAEYLRQQGIEANTLRTTHPGEEGEVLAENLMNNANAIAELLDKLLKEYIDSEAEMLEQEEKAQDILEAIHDLAAEKIVKELEMRIQLQDNERKLIDFAVKRIGDNPFRQAEKFMKQFDPNLPLRENGVIGTLIKKMDAAVDAQNKATAQLALGQKDPHDKDAISLANWQDITQKSFDEIMNDLNDLVDFINDMAEAFSKTAELGMAEIEKYTGRMEHTVSVLDHMGKLLDLTGRKYDYGSRKTIIEGSMHNLENAWKEAEHWADLMTQQREASEQTYKELLTTDAEGAEWYKQNVLDKSYELEQDALEKMYTAAEDYLSKVEELWEVGLEEIMSNWEEAVTNGEGFDFLTSSMSRAKSIQEEYLTTTNKLYETNTLMRKVQQNIDKTDSKISKEKLSSFNKEIEAAQKKNQLSVAEMEILKARYELLEAQLALEEAKDAKSIVRLQRDSEGNYGYVYTADQDDVDDKEQEVADKENDLYNLVLGYQNENQEKRIQIQQEYQDAARQLYIDYHDKHLMDEDEYNTKLAELKAQASAKLEAIDSNLAQSAYWLNQVAAEGVSEAWAYSYDDRIASTDKYMQEFTKANEETERLITKIDGIRDTATENAKLGLQDVAKKTNELTIKNDELAGQAQVTADKVAEEMRAVDQLTASLAAQYTEIQNLIDAYYQYAQAMQAAMQAQGPEDAPDATKRKDQSMVDWDTQYAGGTSGAEWEAARTDNQNYYKNETYTANHGTVKAINSFTTQRVHELVEQGKDEEEAKEMGKALSSVLYKAAVVTGTDLSNATLDTVENFAFQQAGTQAKQDKINSDYDQFVKEEKARIANAATGMYTGEWGSEGKLAILHEKELVLNKDDTSNFLKALEIAKTNFNQMIQLQDLSEQYRQNLLNTSLESAMAIFSKNSETLQQDVHITAEFPNVTSSNEIEQAFTNLVNRAAQYASKDGWAESRSNKLENNFIQD